MTVREKSGEKLHLGHRERMRNKLLKHGASVFETYELLEMLLFEVIRHRDTNPQAKRLFQQRETLNGILSASWQELLKSDGIGEKTAKYITSVGNASRLLNLKYGAKRSEAYDSFDKAGRLAAEHFKDCHNYRVSYFLFDNSMSLISVHDIADCDYESAAIKPKIFIDLAMSEGASVAIIAHNHPYGPLGYTDGDRQTHRLIYTALNGVDVLCLEHYVVSGDRYVGMTDNSPHSFLQRPEFISFVERRGRTVSSPLCIGESTGAREYDNGELLEYISSVALCSLPREEAVKISLKLLARCEELTKIFSLKVEELTENFGLPLNSAVHLKVIAALLSRRITDSFVCGGKYTEEELESYFKALYIGCSVETVYAVLLDDKGRFSACELIGDGTVNTASVAPRRFLEAAIKHKCKTVVVSHNHPLGIAKPSVDDYAMTNTLAYALDNAGVELRAHYVVAGVDCEVIKTSKSGEASE